MTAVTKEPPIIWIDVEDDSLREVVNLSLSYPLCEFQSKNIHWVRQSAFVVWVISALEHWLPF
jgi:hypothetical protein